MSQAMNAHDATPVSDMLPLRPVIFEMLLLLNEEERHGYGLMLALKERSAGRWILGPGTLYRTINELLDKKLIEHSRDERVAGKERQYYRMTRLGKQVAAAEAHRMSELVKSAVESRLI